VFFRIALRNVFRNKRRTAFSLGVIVLGMAILCIVIGFVSDSLNGIKRSLVVQFGSVQIADPHYWNSTAKGYEYLIAPETLDRVLALLKSDPRVTGYTEELGFAGLIGNEKNSTLLVSSGLIPHNAIFDYSNLIVNGRPLSDDGSPQIIIGRKMAETLAVKPGDLINIATGTASGSFNAISAKIVGILRYNDLEVEGQIGFVPISFAQKLLRTPGVDRILVKLPNPDDSEGFTKELQAKLDAQGIALQVRPWQELSSLYSSIKAFYDVFAGFTDIGVFILVFFSVLEVLTMSFLERTREVGTIRAVGTRRSQVFAMFLMEGTILGFLGGLLGVLIGTGLGALINNGGITWIPPGAIEPIPLQVQLGISVAITPFLTALISTFLSTFYPAWKTAQLRIVSALSYV
jgi:putative ABC transport system permease protein